MFRQRSIKFPPCGLLRFMERSGNISGGFFHGKRQQIAPAFSEFVTDEYGIAVSFTGKNFGGKNIQRSFDFCGDSEFFTIQFNDCRSRTHFSAGNFNAEEFCEICYSAVIH